MRDRLGEGADEDQQNQQRSRREEERRDEERGDQQNGDAEPLVEPLAVEDEEKRTQHDARTGVVLQDDDHERHADDHPHLQQVAGPVDRERIGTHGAGQRQRRSDLNELDGLDAHRAEFEPRLGAVDLAAEEQCGDEHGQAGEISRVGEHVEEPLVEQQHDERGARSDADPDGLLHVEMRRGEHVDRILVIRRGEDRHGPQDDDDGIEQDRPQVEVPEDSGKTANGHRRGNRYSCS